MNYLKYLKDIVIIITLIFSLISIRNSQSEIQNLEINLKTLRITYSKQTKL